MTNDEKLMRMFTDVYGEITGACYTEFERDEDGEAVGVHVMKDGNLCWSSTKPDLLFDYITKEWGAS